ncbi:hypothetical protein [uncultured Roseibium sp.]|uniref:hypothetical protein n=1 Tax=uncultured Roseibium sp. TaxID=1936171 RepID=UPI00262455C0|nr:hypothetical protein [uncultured Roseibium sp.]
MNEKISNSVIGAIEHGVVCAGWLVGLGSILCAAFVFSFLAGLPAWLVLKILGVM